MTTNEAQHDPQLLKGVLNLILLRLLARGESYGYEIVSNVHALGLPSVNDGTIYPALNRLEREGHISSRLVKSSSGPARKYYTVTERGTIFADALDNAWTDLAQIVQQISHIDTSPTVRNAV